jgi:IMP cyclohydrolase
VLSQIILGKKVISSLAGHQYEPDDPNFTPRITGVCAFETDCPFSLAILRKSMWDDSCDRFGYYYESIEKGFGYCITTYTSDGNPLPPFKGEPLLMRLTGDIGVIANTYWEMLNKENRVALAVKFIPAKGPSQIKAINRFAKI